MLMVRLELYSADRHRARIVGGGLLRGREEERKSLGQTIVPDYHVSSALNKFGSGQQSTRETFSSFCVCLSLFLSFGNT